MGMQMFQQLCGINTAMYYSGVILKSAGFNSNTQAILFSDAVAFTNSVSHRLRVFSRVCAVMSTLLAMKLIDKTGRRRLLQISLVCLFLFACRLFVLVWLFVLCCRLLWQVDCFCWAARSICWVHNTINLTYTNTYTQAGFPQCRTLVRLMTCVTRVPKMIGLTWIVRVRGVVSHPVCSCGWCGGVCMPGNETGPSAAGKCGVDEWHYNGVCSLFGVLFFRLSCCVLRECWCSYCISHDVQHCGSSIGGYLALASLVWYVAGFGVGMVCVVCSLLFFCRFCVFWCVFVVVGLCTLDVAIWNFPAGSARSRQWTGSLSFC